MCYAQTAYLECTSDNGPSFADGQRYTVRLLRPDDGDSLGEFFTGLSEATLKRYQPHEMTAGHARCVAWDDDRLLIRDFDFCNNRRLLQN
jgi:hypothetical protein